MEDPRKGQKIPTLRDYLSISLFWFPISLFWGAMLGQLLPDRVVQFSGEAAKGTYYGMVGGLGALASTLIQLLIGAMSDACGNRWGRRRPFIFWGTVFAIPSLFLFAYAGNFWMLVISFLLIQFWLNVANGPYQALIPDHIPREYHGRAAMFMGISQLLGQAGGPVTAGILLHAAKSNPAPFSQTTALLIIVSVVSLLLIITGAVTLTAVPDWPAAPAQQRPLLSVLWSSLRVPLRLDSYLRGEFQAHPNFYWLLASRSFANLAFYTTLAFLPFFVRDSLKFGDKNYNLPLGYLELLATVGALLGTVPSGMLSDRMSKRTLVQISCAIVAVAAGAFTFASNLPVIYALALVFGIGWGAFAAVDWAFACNLLPDGGSARYMAIWHICMTVPQVIAPLLYGRIGDAIEKAHGQGNGWRVAMAFSLVYVVVGGFLIRKVREGPLKH